VNYGRDWEAQLVADIALAEAGFRCPNCDGTLQEERGIEIAHVFRLDYIYTEPMDVHVLNDEGEQVRPTMGCYGLGLERLLAAAVEEHHDEQGIIWPASIAPYDVHIVGIGLDRDEAVATDADALYGELQEAGLDVLFDDRPERPGVKFNDADLIGVPIRLTVSSRNHEAGVVELKRRDAEEAESVPRAAVIERVEALRRELMEALQPLA
jgi:prolyl-tRNA synthetase